MVEFNKKIDMSVSCPDHIDVPLVRADYQETENIFRVCFEIFLAIASCIGGHILGGQNITQFEIIIFWIFVIIMLVSIFFSIQYRDKSKLPKK